MNEVRASRRAVAVVALLGTTLMWGTSFVTVKRCGEVLHTGGGVESAAFGPLLLTAVRFTVAAPLVWLWWPAARRWRLRRAQVVPLLKVAAAMAAGFLVQAAGLAWTTATLSAFLTSLVVCLTPLAEWVFHRRGVDGRLGLAVGLATGGAALMTLTRGGGYSFGAGEALTLLCAACYALQILWTNEGAERVGPAGLTVGSFAFVAVAGWAVVLIGWGPAVPAALRAAVAGPAALEFAWMFAVIVALATIGAMVLMNTFQRYIRPSEAAVIYTTEPVFAGVMAYLYMGPAEALGLWGLIGAGVILCADLAAGLKFGEEPVPPLPIDHTAATAPGAIARPASRSPSARG
jgi:drug/metabolite transporter (DMT)-like permease